MRDKHLNGRFLTPPAQMQQPYWLLPLCKGYGAFPHKLHASMKSDWKRKRSISTSRLNTLLYLHLKPINVVVFHGPKSNLGLGFALICFQHLSIPNIATQRFSWYQSWYTRGLFIPVLSSHYFPCFQECRLYLHPSDKNQSRVLAYYLHDPVPLCGTFRYHISPSQYIYSIYDPSRYGVKPKIVLNSSLVFFLLVP